MNERRLAVLISSSEYQNPILQNLRCPVNDVEGLKEILSSKDYGDFAEAIVLVNKPYGEILLKLNQIIKQATKNDLVLIYYSGHGKLNNAGKLHLTTTDTIVDSLEATSIPLEAIKGYIDVSPANKFLIILDSCFSGAAGEAFTKGNVNDQLQLASGGRGTYIMSGSTGIQTAIEEKGEKYSVFTKHIIEGIKSGNAANDEGLVTADSLYSYVHDHVLKDSHQEPMKWDLNVRGDLVIARSGPKREERAKQIQDLLKDQSIRDVVPDEIMYKSLYLVSMPRNDLSEYERKFDDLLDKLLKKYITVRQFIGDWHKIELESIKTKNINVGDSNSVEMNNNTKQSVVEKTIGWENKFIKIFRSNFINPGLIVMYLITTSYLVFLVKRGEISIEQFNIFILVLLFFILGLSIGFITFKNEQSISLEKRHGLIYSMKGVGIILIILTLVIGGILITDIYRYIYYDNLFLLQLMMIFAIGISVLILVNSITSAKETGVWKRK